MHPQEGRVNGVSRGYFWTYVCIQVQTPHTVHFQLKINIRSQLSVGIRTLTQQAVRCWLIFQCDLNPFSGALLAHFQTLARAHTIVTVARWNGLEVVGRLVDIQSRDTKP
jgi:hypothetical protein